MRRVFVTLTFLFLAVTQTARADFGRCDVGGYYFQFDRRLTDAVIPPGPCRTVVDNLVLDGGPVLSHMRLIMDPAGSTTHNAEIVADATDLAARASDAMREMGGIQIQDVTILLTDLPAPVDPVSHATLELIAGGHSECHVTVYKSSAGARDSERVKFLLAHELFHCIQTQNWWDLNRMEAAKWWLEGSAEYFANVVYRHSSQSNAKVSGFETRRETSLTRMDYPAVVFFFWYGQINGLPSVPRLISSMPVHGDIGEPSQRRQLRLSVPIADWLRFEQDYLDERIRTPGGDALATHPSPGPVTRIGASGSWRFSTAPFAISAAQLTFESGHNYRIDPIRLPPNSLVHWSENRGAWTDPPSSVTACDSAREFRQALGSVEDTATISIRITASAADSRECCPDGSGSDLRGVRPLSGGADECPNPEPEDAGEGPGGSSYGEPHILTFDGYEYTFQMVGEFVLARARDGFEIQTRQEKLPNQDVSANTAIAVRLGTHRLAIYAHSFEGISSEVSRVYLDGKPIRVDDTGVKVGGAFVRARGDNAFDVALSTGYRLNVDFFDWDGFKYLDVEVHIPKAGRGAFSGLMGNYDGNAENDLAIKGGGTVSANRSAYDHVKNIAGQILPPIIPLDPLANAYFEKLYRNFGNSWRVTTADSLFDYGPGQSTADYTLQDFPKHYVTLGSIDPKAVADAQAICEAAHVPARTMNGCIFDVAVTGNSGFASALEIIANSAKERGIDEIRRRLPGIPGIPTLP